MLNLRSPGRRALLLICLLCLPGSLAAQQSPPPTRLALEVTFFPGRKPAFQAVPAVKTRGTWYASFGRIASWQPPIEARVPRAVRIVPSVEGDAVRVVVSLLSGEKAFDHEEQIGNYLIRENEKISADELQQFGIEPFGIKLVRVAPNVTPVPPVILKGVTSIVVENAVAVDETLPAYKITLFNQSTRNIVALAADVVTGDKVELGGRPREPEGQPLALAGKSYDLLMPAPIRAREAPGGFEPATLSGTQVVISAVVFDDGTYEGDAESAFAVTAFRAGEKMEIPRLLPALDSALNSQLTDVDASLLRLRMELASVSSDADPNLVQSLAAKFPQLGTERFKHALEVSATMTKANLIKDIRALEVEAYRTHSLSPNALHDFLTARKEKYARWLARL